MRRKKNIKCFLSYIILSAQIDFKNRRAILDPISEALKMIMSSKIVWETYSLFSGQVVKSEVFSENPQTVELLNMWLIIVIYMLYRF